MDSTSPSIPLLSESVLTAKQRKLIDSLSLAISGTGIKVAINEPFTIPKDKVVALDVEHDESGGFVGCGFYFGTSIAYYYSDLLCLNRIPVSTLDIVAHNGISDIEILNEWGMNVNYERLVWDVYLIGHIMDSSYKLYGLKDMAKREIGLTYPSYDDIVGKRGLKAERITLDKQPMELVAAYNSLDVYCTWKLYLKQKKGLNI